MRKIKDIKEFCRYVLSAVGSGYKYYKVNEIPKSKYEDPIKLERILLKVDAIYKTEMNKDWRYRNKLEGNANYQGFYYLGKIYLFRTNGIRLAEEEKGFKSHFDKIDLELSENLGLILFRDERNKLTFRLSKKYYKAKKEKLKYAIRNNDGKSFHYELKMLKGFPTYRGIQLQRIDIKKYINRLQKQQKFKFNVPLYL